VTQSTPEPGALAANRQILTRLQPAFTGARRALLRLERTRPLYVVGGFIVAEWIVTFALALTIRHDGWLWYQGGDQVWYYTTSWLAVHGHLAAAYVGYGWSTLLMPISLVSGPNLLNALPAIILLNVLVLMPVAMTATYGIGERLGGRLFGYWVLLLWLALPFIGIKYTDAGFKQRYTELALPDSFGLTSLSEFPCMAMLAVSAYFCLRALKRPAWFDGVLAGVFAGFAIGIKPSSSVFLVGVVLALLACRNRIAIAAFAVGVAPGIVALAFWKWRGLGYLPLFQADHALRLALGPTVLPLAALDVHKYVNLDWGQFQNNLGSLREHFWSARVVEWTVVAGLIGLARRGRAAFLVLGGWFVGYVVVRVANPLGSLETGALLKGLLPSIPSFVMIVAALPLLVPGVPRRLRPGPANAWGTPRRRLTAIVAAVLLFAVVPITLAGITSRATSGYVYTEPGPIPVDGTLDLHATVAAGRVQLAWNRQHPATISVFYEVLRAKADACSNPPDLWTCSPTIATTRAGSYVDSPPKGLYDYRILLDADWLNDQLHGDEYLASPPVRVMVP
jgi:hypothetical protein